MKNWPDLRTAITQLADAVDTVEDDSNEYGTFYRGSGGEAAEGLKTGVMPTTRRP
jgi:hypothetical protein